ncbi:MAG: DEAD/DEAH box helicase, partial [Anaerolineae bacterium]|nr:DEAD/DEAH box helicase [Anaerolineae bacterium]
LLHPGFRTLCSEDLPLNRPLYLHQDRAVEKIVAGGRNIVVATGTGSGKTEAFLIPILNHLLREQEAGTLDRPGVRALLLYPMNALANDQLRRLRR